MVLLWFPYGVPIVFQCILRFSLVSVWFCYGFPMFLYKSIDFLYVLIVFLQECMLFHWFSYVLGVWRREEGGGRREDVLF